MGVVRYAAKAIGCGSSWTASSARRFPRVRDFRGTARRRSFDGRGNYTMGIREQIIFPEINYDDVQKIHGMDITFVTSTDKDDEASRCFVSWGLPFRGRGAGADRRCRLRERVRMARKALIEKNEGQAEVRCASSQPMSTLRTTPGFYPEVRASAGSASARSRSAERSPAFASRVGRGIQSHDDRPHRGHADPHSGTPARRPTSG